ncbi:baseplate J/gp47 family protein [Pyxidicoccus parkwayensis]|uniref:Baseplate J/gp47 family protein n=1 Tax=Pyxidicoccus parkwayensis TaxID=2813578 RepID=A0ABX7NVP8_9BACT|nr:baseplate J/gp47 family protein [Pyxidicoccus parkwaysis]QSQ22773.1 baseplate J/gp47 family protein [Pyxidicoccus parkwaysis]
MSKSTDITRWNRAGLRRIRYVDANAATLLEEIRARLDERFNASGPSVRWPAMQAPEVETESERQARLLAQYEAQRASVPDWGWEIARALARATHVLTEHVDAYANEGYLGTATQWESLRRLVEMIDYHPSPPASAFTPLVVHAKAGARGTLGRGFAVRHSPPDGGAPVTFETLDDLDVDAALNVLRPAGHGVNPDALGHSTKRLVLEGSISGINAGEPVVLESEADGQFLACVVESVVQEAETTTVRVTPTLPSNVFTKGRTRVHVRPKERLAPQGPLRTGGSVGLTLRLAVEPRGLLAGDIITLSDGQRRYYRRVTGVEGKLVGLDRGVGELALELAVLARPVVVPVARQMGTRVIGASEPPTVEHFVQVPGAWQRLNGETLGDPRAFEDPVREYEVHVVSAAEVPVETTDEANRGYTLLKLTQPRAEGESPESLLNPQAFLAPPPASAGGWAVDTFLMAGDSESLLPATLWTDKPKGLAAGDFAVVVTGVQASWGRLASVGTNVDLGRAELVPVDGWQGRGGGEFPRTETRVYGRFQEVARLVGWDENATPLSGTQVPLDAVPAGLTFGRPVVVRQEGGSAPALVTRVQGTGEGFVALVDPLPAGSTVDNLVLHANVVLAGHGEKKPEQVLGSGDATRTSQAFVLRERGISFIADATRASGVRADLEVKVAGRVWNAVESLRESGPTDPHYTVRLVRDGELAVVFGDGRNGRRLPTGANNVRVTFRAGSGLGGNLASGSLAKPSRPHPLVEAVEQPLPASGGNDMEDVEALRRTAPATVLTLQRAVSTEDFASLAMGHSSVWQARAMLKRNPGSRQELVEVVVVPADGGELGPLKQSLADFLRAHALPGVDVSLSRYLSEPVTLDVEMEVDTRAFNPDAVVQAVRSALLDALSLRRRGLGQALYLSDVYKVVEAVTGVESSICVLAGVPGLQRKDAPSGAHVVYLNPDGQGLSVRFKEYSL